jgi:hypothetical protein
MGGSRNAGLALYPLAGAYTVHRADDAAGAIRPSRANRSVGFRRRQRDGDVDLSRHADAIVVAPASADFIAKGT